MVTRGRILSRGMVLLILLGLLVGAGLTAVAAKPLDAGNSPEHRLREYAVDIPIAGTDRVIAATLAVPKAGGPNAEHPAVLMLHGFGSQKDEVGDMYKRVARYMAVAGYASLRIDFAAADEGDLQPAFDRMVGDALVALDWLEANRRTDDDRLGVLGFSFGSRVAAVVAGTDDRVQAMASWSGAVANGRTNFEDNFDTPYDPTLNPEACPGCTQYDYAQKYGSVVVNIGFRLVELSAEWYDTLDASTAQDDVGGFTGALLAIAGTEDTVVDPIWSRQLVFDAGSLDATLRIIEGADHIYNVFGDQALAEMAMQLTAKWFADKL